MFVWRQTLCFVEGSFPLLSAAISEFKIIQIYLHAYRVAVLSNGALCPGQTSGAATWNAVSRRLRRYIMNVIVRPGWFYFRTNRTASSCAPRGPH